MKKFNFLPALLCVTFLTSPAYAGLNDYISEMNAKGLPKVLVVGCGHSPEGGLEGDHTHPHCYSVDIENPEAYEMQKTIREGTISHCAFLKSDEVLDITSEYISYRNAFDVVLLERNWPKTLNHNNTLYNAASMLKPGGDLVVDSNPHYYFNAYEGYRENYDGSPIKSLRSEVDPQRLEFYNKPDPILYAIQMEKDLNINTIRATTKELEECGYAGYDTEKIITAFKAQLERFGVPVTTDTQRVLVDDKLVNMAEYLSAWGFENVLPLRSVYQPWTKTPDGDIKTARRGPLLVATKTVQTKEWMSGWRNLIWKYKDTQSKGKK